jgi:hypothetical protein
MDDSGTNPAAQRLRFRHRQAGGPIWTKKSRFVSLGFETFVKSLGSTFGSKSKYAAVRLRAFSHLKDGCLHIGLPEKLQSGSGHAVVNTLASVSIRTSGSLSDLPDTTLP